jgi:DNA polymerase III delta subunit
MVKQGEKKKILKSNFYKIVKQRIQSLCSLSGRSGEVESEHLSRFIPGTPGEGIFDFADSFYSPQSKEKITTNLLV